MVSEDMQIWSVCTDATMATGSPLVSGIGSFHEGFLYSLQLVGYHMRLLVHFKGNGLLGNIPGPSSDLERLKGTATDLRQDHVRVRGLTDLVIVIVE